MLAFLFTQENLKYILYISNNSFGFYLLECKYLKYFDPLNSKFVILEDETADRHSFYHGIPGAFNTKDVILLRCKIFLIHSGKSVKISCCVYSVSNKFINSQEI